MESADEVSKFEITIEVNEKQSSNILLYLFIFVPLNLDKSISVILSHLVNIFSQVVKSPSQISSILLKESFKYRILDLIFVNGLLLLIIIEFKYLLKEELKIV